MTKLQKDYQAAITAYLYEFDKIYDTTLNFVNNSTYEVADLYLDFSDIKFAVDNELSFNFLVDWYFFSIEYHEKVKITLPDYVEKRNEYLKEKAESPLFFCLHTFEKKLLYDKI